MYVVLSKFPLISQDMKYKFVETNLQDALEAIPSAAFCFLDLMLITQCATLAISS